VIGMQVGICTEAKHPGAQVLYARLAQLRFARKEHLRPRTLPPSRGQVLLDRHHMV